LVDSEVGDGGAAEMRHLWFLCLLLLELLHWGSGYGIMVSLFSLIHLLTSFGEVQYGSLTTLRVWSGRLLEFQCMLDFCKFRLCYFHIARVSSYRMHG